MTALTEAIVIAATAHDGQVDKAGQPYILHALRVMAAMFSDHDRVVAVLHDVVEDSPDWQLADLAEFGPGVVEALDALTRRDGETYDDYVNRVSLNACATRVKLADLRDNLDLTRLPEPNDVDVARCVKYRRARAILQSSLVAA